MPLEIRPDPEPVTPEHRRTDPGTSARRIRLRIRDLLVAVVVVALVAAGVAESRRAARIRAERALLEILRAQEAASEAIDAVLMELGDSTPENLDRREADRITKDLREAEKHLEESKRRLRELKLPRPEREGIFPDPDRRGLPDDGRVVL